AGEVEDVEGGRDGGLVAVGVGVARGELVEEAGEVEGVESGGSGGEVAVGVAGTAEAGEEDVVVAEVGAGEAARGGGGQIDPAGAVGGHATGVFTGRCAQLPEPEAVAGAVVAADEDVVQTGVRRRQAARGVAADEDAAGPVGRRGRGRILGGGAEL